MSVNLTLNSQEQKSRSLDLGCGENPQNPFNASCLFGIDFLRTAESTGQLVEVKRADLTIEPIPYPDEFFDFVTAFDFIEHVPRLIYINSQARLPFVNLMKEVHRVLRPGGTFYSLTPAYPSPKAFQDPTHVNFITDETLPKYFCGDFPWAHSYGFDGKFTLISQEWMHESHLSCHMRKRH